MLAITTLDTKKKILNPRDENIFYNKIFRTNGRTIVPNETTRRHGIYKYGQLLDEVQKRTNHQQYIRGIATVYDNITEKDLYNRQEHILITLTQGKIIFNMVTEKNLYEEILIKKYYEHHSTLKWVQQLNDHIEWKDVWEAVHNPLATEDTKTLIWEQIHLNMYTTHSYNKWHKRN